jgi:hypothetical protein
VRPAVRPGESICALVCFFRLVKGAGSCARSCPGGREWRAIPKLCFGRIFVIVCKNGACLGWVWVGCDGSDGVLVEPSGKTVCNLLNGRLTSLPCPSRADLPQTGHFCRFLARMCVCTDRISYTSHTQTPSLRLMACKGLLTNTVTRAVRLCERVGVIQHHFQVSVQNSAFKIYPEFRQSHTSRTAPIGCSIPSPTLRSLQPKNKLINFNCESYAYFEL